jgi:nicotinamidase-related amidase
MSETQFLKLIQDGKIDPSFVITHRLSLNEAASGYSTFNLVLEYLGTHTLVLTGIAGNNRVLFTAHDAYMRDYELIIPADCTASINQQDNDSALQQMQKVLKADIRASDQVEFERGVETGRTRNRVVGI